jgi:hypothetical protein
MQVARTAQMVTMFSFGQHLGIRSTKSSAISAIKSREAMVPSVQLHLSYSRSTQIGTHGPPSRCAAIRYV